MAPSALKRYVTFILCCLFMTCSAISAETMDLAGPWHLRLDPNDIGSEQMWFTRALGDTIELPASLRQRGFGDDVSIDTPWTADYISWGKRGDKDSEKGFGLPRYDKYRTKDNFKLPCWLLPDKYYKNPAWYQKKVNIPASWAGKNITLYLERVHWQSTIWVDDKQIGSNDSLSTPHVYDLSDCLTSGEHLITIRVDNRMIVDIGRNAHSVTDHTQTNWNGIIGKIQLLADAPLRVDNVQVFPDLHNNSIRVKVRTDSSRDITVPAQLKFEIRDDKGKTIEQHTFDVNIDKAVNTYENVIALKTRLKTWDEFNPNLYDLKTTLTSEAGRSQNVTTFGMRKIGSDRTQLLLNGRPISLRGTLECCVFPLTGYPPTDVESWKKVIRACKAHGLNHIRFHSHCPPEAAFIAADELGFYYQVECGAWANAGVTIGGGARIDDWVYAEAERILDRYGSHPSFTMMTYGNEPAGENKKQWLGRFVKHFRDRDSRRLYATGADGPLTEASDFHCTSTTEWWTRWGMRNRIENEPPQTILDYNTIVARFDIPFVTHEAGQWCVYPNFDEMPKYTGVLKPKNFEIFRDFLQEKGMLHQAKDFLMASGKLQVLCYKENIESILRTPNFGNFQLLDLHDFPGQGTALVGILDPFWDPKPHITQKQWTRFCNTTVPLARFAKYIFTQSETFSAHLEIYHFGDRDIPSPRVYWKLIDKNGVEIKSGQIAIPNLPRGKITAIDTINVPLNSVNSPRQLKLIVGIKDTEFENDWDIWVYPNQPSFEAAADVENILITDSLDDTALTTLRNSGKVLLTAKPKTVKTDVELGFSSIFWNTFWTEGRPPHTMGILCDPNHPALSEFPTDYHSNWQWWQLMTKGAAMELDSLPAKLQPIVQVVPDWHDPKKLALVFEAAVEEGKLLVCSADIETNLENRLAARRLRHSLLKYMTTDAFDPVCPLRPEDIKTLFK